MLTTATKCQFRTAAARRECGEDRRFEYRLVPGGLFAAVGEDLSVLPLRKLSFINAVNIAQNISRF